MSFFKKMFEKKECSICGGEIGLLGNRKLEDGNCCKNCAAKLSPWFDERRHSTVDQIKEQLQYREQNQAALAGFRPVLEFGENYTLRAELQNGVPTRFVVERTDSYKSENADIVNFADVTSFEIDEQEYDRELKRRNDKGEEISYNPPRFEYSYDFYAKITVNHPYFDDMRFKLNKNTIELETVQRSTVGGFGRNTFDPNLYPEYRAARACWDSMQELFNAGMQGRPMMTGVQQPAYGQPMQPAYAQPVYGAAQPMYGNDPIQNMIEQIRNAPDMQTAQQVHRNLSAQIINLPNRQEINNMALQAMEDLKLRIGFGTAPMQQPAYGQPVQTGYAQPMQQPVYGQPVQPAYGQQVPVQQPVQQPVQAAGPKFCPSCGAPATGAKFCQNCGAPL